MNGLRLSNIFFVSGLAAVATGFVGLNSVAVYQAVKNNQHENKLSQLKDLQKAGDNSQPLKNALAVAQFNAKAGHMRFDQLDTTANVLACVGAVGMFAGFGLRRRT